MEEHQREWDKYVQKLTYAYNAQVDRVTNMAPFGLVLPRDPPGPVMVTKTKNYSSDMMNYPPTAFLVT